jgi:uncharacterized protein (TIGR02646 family)
MKFIEKKSEPESLARYRREAYANYDGFDQKDELRQALVDEQGYLCCYCLSRIEANAQRMKIEHWKPQSVDSARALEYRNLLGACKGGDGDPRDLQHCDTSKGDRTLEIDPTDRACEQRVRYNVASGEMYSDDAVVQNDIDVILRLNLKRLVRNRRQVLDDALADMARRHSGEWTIGFIQKERERWSRKNGQGKHAEYCTVVLNYLDRKLMRASTKH